MSPEPTTVLVVDDEAAIREMYADMLAVIADEVLIADGGEAALERLDETVDVVLLDRRMPGLSGDEVLEEIRARGCGCRVAMLTAIDPDEDIAEMAFDTYLTKPVTVSELRETIERLLALDDYDTALEERFRIAQKLGALEASKTEGELAGSKVYGELKSRYRALSEDMESAGEQVDTDLLRGIIEKKSSAGGR